MTVERERLGTEDLIPQVHPGRATHDRSDNYHRQPNSEDPQASHVCRRWCDTDSTQKTGVVVVAILLMVLIPLLAGTACLVTWRSMGSELLLVQINGSVAPSVEAIMFRDECQVFTEQSNYCSAQEQRWQVQQDGSYLCTSGGVNAVTLKYYTPEATYACRGNTPNTDLSPDANGAPCVLARSDASRLYADLESRLLLAGLICWVSTIPVCVGPCWIYGLIDRKSSSHCGCGCCVGLDYRSRGDRAAATTRLLAGWCLSATICSVCVTESFSLWSISSLTAMTSAAQYSCKGSDSSTILDHVILLERMLWLQLGLRYSATIVACCVPLALEQCGGLLEAEQREVSSSVHGAGGQNYAQHWQEQRREVRYGTTRIVAADGKMAP